MRRSIKISTPAHVLLILSFLLISVLGEQTSSSIRSSGIIDYSSHTLALSRYTLTKYFEEMSPEQISELFDMCQAGRWDETKIRQVRQIRPDFRTLLYRNIRAISNYSQDEWLTAVNNNWLLKDVDGNYVQDLIWPGNFMVDIGNLDYQTWIANWIKQYIDLFGYDGVMADCSFHARVGEQWFGLPVQPINPRTGTYWTNEEVRQANIQQFIAIRNTVGSKLIVANGIYQGTRFYARFSEYMEVLSNSPLDGIGSEGLWYQYSGVWMTEEQWLDSLNMLIWFQDNFLKVKPERVFVPTCKLESSTGETYPLPPGATKEQMASYAFASTLLGIKTNQTYLCLQADLDFTRQIVQPMYDVIVGASLNDYYVINGTHVYTRDFSNGKVLVNPTSNSYLIPLEGTFRTLEGEVITEITMKAYTGMILES